MLEHELAGVGVAIGNVTTVEPITSLTPRREAKLCIARVIFSANFEARRWKNSATRAAVPHPPLSRPGEGLQAHRCLDRLAGSSNRWSQRVGQGQAGAPFVPYDGETFQAGKILSPAFGGRIGFAHFKRHHVVAAAAIIRVKTGFAAGW
jgi:hypothetical protein